jgi:hypothetical protein
MTVHGQVQVNTVDDPAEAVLAGSPLGKPFLRLEFPDGVVVNITTNLAEMIGGCGSGLRQRHEAQGR